MAIREKVAIFVKKTPSLYYTAEEFLCPTQFGSSNLNLDYLLIPMILDTEFFLIKYFHHRVICRNANCNQSHMSMMNNKHISGRATHLYVVPFLVLYEVVRVMVVVDWTLTQP